MNASAFRIEKIIELFPKYKSYYSVYCFSTIWNDFTNSQPFVTNQVLSGLRNRRELVFTDILFHRTFF